MNTPYIVPIDVGDMSWDHSEAVLRRSMGVKIKGSFICWYIGGTDVSIVGGDRKKILPGHDRLVFQQERYPK